MIVVVVVLLVVVDTEDVPGFGSLSIAVLWSLNQITGFVTLMKHVAVTCKKPT